MTLQKISLDEFLRLRKLVHRSARPLDYTKWKFLFENGSLDDFLLVLSSYQNEDDGFGYNLRKAEEADIGVTKRLADFILKHADEDSSIYCKAKDLKERYDQCGQVLLNGYLDYDPTALNISGRTDDWKLLLGE